MSEQLSVKNVKCGGCVNAIQEGLGDLSGIEKTEVDIASGQVTLEGKEIDINAVRQRLSEIGFPPAD